MDEKEGVEFYMQGCGSLHPKSVEANNHMLVVVVGRCG